MKCSRRQLYRVKISRLDKLPSVFQLFSFKFRSQSPIPLHTDSRVWQRFDSYLFISCSSLSPALNNAPRSRCSTCLKIGEKHTKNREGAKSATMCAWRGLSMLQKVMKKSGNNRISTEWIRVHNQSRLEGKVWTTGIFWQKVCLFARRLNWELIVIMIRNYSNVQALTKKLKNN